MIDYGAAIGLILLVLIAVGIVLVSWGLRGRVVNRQPHCKACGFDLSSNGFGIDRALGKVVVEPGSDASEKSKCPECGERLTPYGSIVMGLRKKRWGMTVLGAALLLTPAVAIASAAAGFGVSGAIARNAPDFLVIQLGEDVIIEEFAYELRDRLAADELSPEAARALATRCLARVGTLPAQEVHKAWTYQLLVERGWIRPEEVIALIGEPTIVFEVPERSFPRRFPQLFAKVTFDSDRLPPGVSFTIENAPIDATDLAGDFRNHLGVRIARLVSDPGDACTTMEGAFDLVPANFAIGEWNNPPASAYRDYRLRVNVVILCGTTVLKRVEGSRIEGRQRLIQPGDALVEVDMRPEANQAARAFCERIRIVRAPTTPTGAQFEVHLPPESQTPLAFYWVKAKPAGQPNAETVFMLRLPTNVRVRTADGYYTVVVARYPGSEAIAAMDLTFEPDLVAAESALGVDQRMWSIPGETFTIESVPIDPR